MYRVKSGSWGELKQDAKLIRTLVFINEQNIPEKDEWDDQDVLSQHFIIYDQEYPVATARILKNHSIGRVAVLKEYRSKGIGRLIMLKIIEDAQNKNRPFLHMSSQVHAISFYKKLGFSVEGDVYDECGIPHVEMRMLLTGST